MRRSTIIHRSPMAAPAIAVSVNRWRFGRFRVLSSVLPALLLGGWILSSLGWPRVTQAQEAAVVGSGQTIDGAAAQRAEAVVVRREPDLREWRRAWMEVDPSGKMRPRVSSVVEVSTGLHFSRNGQLHETQERFELIEGFAVATNGPHQLALAANANSQAAVELVTPEGLRFRSHVLGLVYADAAQPNGDAVLIATPQDSVGELVAENQILYRGALEGAARCDLRYSYRRDGIEQDLVIRERLPDPAELGFKGRVRLELWTAFVEAPEPVRSARWLKPDAVEAGKLDLEDARLLDETLNFGQMRIGPGRAFLVNGEDDSVAVAKSWVRLEGTASWCLIEKVDYEDVVEALGRLPQAAVRAGNGAPQQAALARRSRAATLAALTGQRRVPATDGAGRMQVAALERRPTAEPGLVLDYQMLNFNTNGMRFQKDTTYFISGSCNLSGTTYLEGGTVIKMTNNLANRLNIQGPLVAETGDYRPALLTSWLDNTVGETIPGSGGTPTNRCGIYFNFGGNTNEIDLHNVRIRHAQYGLQLDSAAQVVLRNAQFSSNYAAVVFGRSRLRNVLIHDGTYAFGGTGTNHHCENVTFHRLTYLRSGTGAYYLTKATNCLIVSVTNNVVYEGANNVSNATSTGVFEAVGSGAHYLTDAYRDLGTTNIDATLLATLRRLTTHPPLVLTNHFTNDTVLRPRAMRDTDAVDPGYHAPAVDFAWSGLKVSNARLTLSNDVVIGIYGSSSTYGIGLESGAELRATGLPHRPAMLVRANLTQEHASGAWSSSTVAPLIQVLTNGPMEPKVGMRFVHSVLPGGEGYHVQGNQILHDDPLGWRDCQFSGGGISVTDVGLALTNCVLDRVNVEIEPTDGDPRWRFYQNLFRGGRLDAPVPANGTASARNNFFDRTTLSVSGPWTNTHNGYVQGQNYLSPTNQTDIRVTTVAYEKGPLGWYYYPTNGGAGSLTDLVNKGSTNANLLGFSYFTGATNQTVEGSSVIDLGFRYMAVNALGEPRDSDGDGLPDYLEDLDGDGVLDGGETDWNGYNSLFGLSGTPGLQVFTPLK